MSRFKSIWGRFQPIINRIEPITIFLTYVSICFGAYFAWFFPPDSSRLSLTQLDLIIQAILLTIGGTASLAGHLSDRIFIEEIGIIFAAVGVTLYCYALVNFILRIDRFLDYGEAVAIMAIAIFLLIARAIRIQHLLSAKWLKPRVAHIYEDE